MKTFAYLFLDEALGEFDVETKVGLLQFLPADDPVDGERYSLAELPERFDKLYAELNGFTGKPS